MHNNQPPVTLTTSLNSLRTTYMSLFNQILDNSININCICKTTYKTNAFNGHKSDATASKLNNKKKRSTVCSFPTVSNVNIFDKANDFLESDDDDEEEEEEEAIDVDDNSIREACSLNDYNINDVEMKEGNENENSRQQNKLFNLDYLTEEKKSAKTAIKTNKICDLTCFENLKFVSWSLKNCFRPKNEVKGLTELLENNIIKSDKSLTDDNDDISSEDLERFERTWASFKFLSKNPKSCDYYGTTIFHYAAADNCYHLLRCIVNKYPQGVFAIDSKGMTPLMRAVQRNSIKCVEFLLSETDSDISGSSFSTYTPLWFSVSNGYNEIVKLLLNYGAIPSIVDKSTLPINRAHLNSGNVGNSQIYNDINNLATNQDHIGVLAHQPNSTQQNATVYLFSPLRASIVYARFTTMMHLLEFGANVYELFGPNSATLNLPIKRAHPSQSMTKPNEDWINALKFFHRQFGAFISRVNASSVDNSYQSEMQSKSFNKYDKYLNELNDFIQNQNIYRRMFIEFVRDICFKININLSLFEKINVFLANRSINKYTVEYLAKLTDEIEIKGMMENSLGDEIYWRDYVEIINEFMVLVDSFIQLQINGNQANEAEQIFGSVLEQNQLIKKPNYHQNMIEFARFLVDKFSSKPKSLKELSRFTIRRLIFEKINSSNTKYKKTFLKSDHQLFILNNLSLPTNLRNYVLHINDN